MMLSQQFLRFQSHILLFLIFLQSADIYHADKYHKSCRYDRAYQNRAQPYEAVKAIAPQASRISE